jgi:hypothetical protein
MVFGHSSGCVLALEAARAGLPITQLALYEPPFVIDRTTRLLLGGKSPEWIANAAHRLERVLPAGELTVLDGQTHMLKPTITAPVVRQFFTDRTTATSDLGERV